MHLDVNAPESFALGALTKAPLPRVYKEAAATRSQLLKYCRENLRVSGFAGLSPCSPQGPEEARFFGARLLTLGRQALDEGVERPFPTTSAAERYRAWNACADVSDVVLIPGGTPCDPEDSKNGPPSPSNLFTAFLLVCCPPSR